MCENKVVKIGILHCGTSMLALSKIVDEHFTTRDNVGVVALQIGPDMELAAIIELVKEQDITAVTFDPAKEDVKKVLQSALVTQDDPINFPIMPTDRDSLNFSMVDEKIRKKLEREHHHTDFSKQKHKGGQSSCQAHHKRKRGVNRSK